MSKTVEQRVIHEIARQLGIDDEPVKPEQNIFDDLGADSLDAIELVMELEEEFGIEIHDEDAEKVQTVQEAIDLVKRLVG